MARSGGRKPLPTELKLIRGTELRRINLSSPEMPGVLKDPPQHLSDSQKIIWRDALSNSPKGLLRAADWSVFMVWVIATDLHDQAQKSLRETGALITVPREVIESTSADGTKTTRTKGAQTYRSPAIALINQQSQIIMRAVQELGFTPVARSRIKMSPSADQPNRFTNN